MKFPKSFDFSQSNLKDYLDCPYRFYLKNILHTKWPALLVDDAFEFELRGIVGARFHRLVQQYLLDIPKSRLTEIAEADPDPMFIQWWENFLEFVPPYLVGQRYVERTLSTRLTNQRVVAKYDLILVQKDKLLIFDWKTSRQQLKKEWLLDRVQTRLYRMILAQSWGTFFPSGSLNPEDIIMNYWFAAHPNTPISLPYSKEAYQEDLRFFEDLIRGILDLNEENFYRTENSDKCRYCVYRSHCDRGIQAGDIESFDSFTLDEEDFELDLDFDEIQEIEF